MIQQHAEQIVHIFKRLVAAKLTGSLSESARAYSDLNALADHVAIVQEHNGFAAPPAALRAPRAGSKAAPVRAPHEDAEGQGQADRDRREVGGAAGDRGARLLGLHGCGPGTLTVGGRHHSPAILRTKLNKGVPL
jgi:hypothetical protein